MLVVHYFYQMIKKTALFTEWYNIFVKSIFFIRSKKEIENYLFADIIYEMIQYFLKKTLLYERIRKLNFYFCLISIKFLLKYWNW